MQMLFNLMIGALDILGAVFFIALAAAIVIALVVLIASVAKAAKSVKSK